MDHQCRGGIYPQWHEPNYAQGEVGKMKRGKKSYVDVDEEATGTLKKEKFIQLDGPEGRMMHSILSGLKIFNACYFLGQSLRGRVDDREGL